MQQTTFTVDFSKVQSVPLVYDLTLASNHKRIQQLAEFVVAYYRSECDHVDKDDYYGKGHLYQLMIDTCIRFDNLDGLATLWNGIYYHDRDNPDFLNDLYVAAQYGSLRMFKHVLYGYINYASLNWKDHISCLLLSQLAAHNPCMKELVEKMVRKFSENGVIDISTLESKAKELQKILQSYQ
jgi:hypothetical protein